MSTQEKNKEMVRHAVEHVWNKGDYTLMNELLDKDFVMHSLNPNKVIRGPQAVKEFYTTLRSAFPDIRFTITDQIAEGDKVVTQWVAEGTHRGDFGNIRATGKKIRVSAIDIDHIKEGKFTDCWTNMDELGLMQQLGVVEDGSNLEKKKI